MRVKPGKSRSLVRDYPRQQTGCPLLSKGKGVNELGRKQEVSISNLSLQRTWLCPTPALGDRNNPARYPRQAEVGPAPAAPRLPRAVESGTAPSALRLRFLAPGPPPTFSGTALRAPNSPTSCSNGLAVNRGIALANGAKSRRSGGAPTAPAGRPASAS